MSTPIYLPPAKALHLAKRGIRVRQDTWPLSDYITTDGYGGLLDNEGRPFEPDNFDRYSAGWALCNNRDIGLMNKLLNHFDSPLSNIKVISISANEAFKKAERGESVRHCTWSIDGHISYKNGKLQDDKGKYVPANVFSDFKDGWEYVVQGTEDEELLTDTIRPSTMTFEEHNRKKERDFWATSSNNNIGRGDCDCGAKYTSHKCSDWCKSVR